MKADDFVLKWYDAEYQDYWFDVVGQTREELSDKYRDLGVIGISDAVISLSDGQWGLRLARLFNSYAITPEDDELHELLQSLAVSQRDKTSIFINKGGAK